MALKAPTTSATGARGSALTLAERWALPFMRAGRQTVVFGKSRVAVEIMLSNLRERLRQDLGPRSRVRGYRGGYLPTERRAIERGLRDGEVLGVVSTNALELGVDIGRLDVAVLAGYPGSIAGTWQQMGRAGRRGGTSVAVLIAGGGPVDRYVVEHPEFLLDSPPEEARLERVANPHRGTAYVTRLAVPEFTSLCPVTGQPDFAHLMIDYVPGDWLLESKSLKLYVASFRNHGAFHEDCTVSIGKRISAEIKPKWLRIGGYWYPRGGIPIDVFWQTGKVPKGTWMPDQGVAPYRGRG